MPIYEYVCEKCGNRIEVLQKISDEPLKRCRSCRGKLEKVVSRTSFQLKGGGWYKTDYSSSPASKSEKSGDKAGEKSEKSDKSDKKKSDTTSSAPSGGSASAKAD